jgi:hypothetical protein
MFMNGSNGGDSQNSVEIHFVLVWFHEGSKWSLDIIIHEFWLNNTIFNLKLYDNIVEELLAMIIVIPYRVLWKSINLGKNNFFEIKNFSF